MKRLDELVELIRARHPSDPFFTNYKWKLSVPELGDDYRAYGRALESLDFESWEVLKTKAASHFRNHRHGQLKQGFFNQLNEAFAYRHLVQQGYKSVRVLRESGKPQPDIEYFNRGQRLLCEVKTLGTSDAEIDRRKEPKLLSSAIYRRLPDTFFGKLRRTLEVAEGQLGTRSGMIYLVVLFDDFTLEHYGEYRKQVQSFIQAHALRRVYAQVGLRGRRRIEVSPTPGI